MHEAAVVNRNKGLSLEASARPFVGNGVELDVVAGEAQGGICTRCYEMTYEDLKVLVVPDRDLDPIKFGLFVEHHTGARVHIRAVVDGGAPGFTERSPLALRILSIEPAPSSGTGAKPEQSGPAAPQTSARTTALTDVRAGKENGGTLPPPHPSDVAPTRPTEGSSHTSAPVELLHTMGAVVTVSSTVANDAHRPEHLTDGNVSTAWNSRTDALAGSWIQIELPSVVRLSRLRITAGFTTSGPNGDDWFTMNQRIRQIRVSVDGKELGDFTLDPNVRDLQSVGFSVTGKTIRIEIRDVMPGSKKNWREVCVSELELWGYPAVAMGASKAVPIVRVDDGTQARCPDKPRIQEALRTKSATASRGTLEIDRCVSAHLAGGSWYVTASVTLPATQNDVAGHYFLLRGVLDKNGRLVVMREDEDDAFHRSLWDSVEVRGTDAVVEELSGGGGVRHRDRLIFSISGTEISRRSTERVGEYEPDGTFTPAGK